MYYFLNIIYLSIKLKLINIDDLNLTEILIGIK